MKYKANAVPNSSLRRERELRGWSQQELAERIDAPSSYYISRWERGVISPSPLYRERLCAIFDKNAQELDLLSEPQKPPDLVASEVDAASMRPAHWLVPYRRNPFFTGRSDVLEQLHASLCSAQAVALTQSLALYGLGGIGKTQTAVEYAYRYAHAYRAIFWIGAETAESMHVSLVQIADLLELPEREAAERSRLMAAMCRWLANHQEWLLIVDNVEDLDLLQAVQPSLRHGALLLTTRRHALGTLAQSLEIPPMSVEEGVALLLSRARPLHVQSGEPTGMSQDAATVAQAAELVHLLEGLPLALDQAGAYLQETGGQVADYVQRYTQQRKEVLARRGIHGGNHPASVTTTVMLAVEQVAREHPVAPELLRLCAFLHAEAIPEELLVEGAPHLGPVLGPTVADPYQFDLLLAALRSVSLLTRHTETKTLSLHRLVQVVLLDSMTETEQEQWSGRAIEALAAVFPAVEHATWKRCGRLLPHALVCLRRSETAEGPLALAALSNKAAHYLLARGQYAEAAPLYGRAVQIREQILGPEHPEVARALNELAITCWMHGKYAEAETLYGRALQIREQVLGPEHPDLARTLNGLAVLHWSRGKYEEAEALYQRARCIWERTLGPDHTNMALALNGLAVLYTCQGKYEEAEVLYQRALQIWERALGAEHPDLALPLANLAELYVEQSKYGEAEALYQRAWQIREQALGPDHPDMAVLLNGRADLYVMQHKYPQAEALYQRALHMREQAFGAEHPEVAFSLDGLATLYRKQGRHEQAEQLYQRALSIREEKLGHEHPDMASSLHGLAAVYVQRGKYELAIAFYQRAVHIFKRSMGEMHTRTKRVVYEYNAVLQALGRTSMEA